MNKKEIYAYCATSWEEDKLWSYDLTSYPLATIIALACMLEDVVEDRNQDKSIHPQTHIAAELTKLGLDEVLDAEILWQCLINRDYEHDFVIDEFIPDTVYDGAKGSPYTRLGITSQCDDAPHLLMITHFTIKPDGAEESYIAPRNHRDLLNFIKP